MAAQNAKRDGCREREGRDEPEIGPPGRVDSSPGRQAQRGEPDAPDPGGPAGPVNRCGRWRLCCGSLGIGLLGLTPLQRATGEVGEQVALTLDGGRGRSRLGHLRRRSDEARRQAGRRLAVRPVEPVHDAQPRPGRRRERDRRAGEGGDLADRGLGGALPQVDELSGRFLDRLLVLVRALDRQLGPGPPVRVFSAGDSAVASRENQNDPTQQGEHQGCRPGTSRRRRYGLNRDHRRAAAAIESGRRGDVTPRDGQDKRLDRVGLREDEPAPVQDRRADGAPGVSGVSRRITWGALGTGRWQRRKLLKAEGDPVQQSGGSPSGEATEDVARRLRSRGQRQGDQRAATDGHHGRVNSVRQPGQHRSGGADRGPTERRGAAGGVDDQGDVGGLRRHAIDGEHRHPQAALGDRDLGRAQAASGEGPGQGDQRLGPAAGHRHQPGQLGTGLGVPHPGGGDPGSAQ